MSFNCSSASPFSLAMAAPLLVPGAGVAVTGAAGCRLYRTTSVGPRLSRGYRKRRTGTISPVCRLGTCTANSPSRLLRNLASACTFTCQVRPKRLKSFTYSEPKYCRRAVSTSATCTPVVSAASRSNSSHTHGLFELVPLNAPINSGVFSGSFATATTASAFACTAVVVLSSPTRSSSIRR